MIYSILLIFEKPNLNKPDTATKWKETLRKVSDLTTNTNTDFQTLAENVFLLSLNKTLNILSDLLILLAGHSYKYSIFDQEIEWHEEPKGIDIFRP